MWKCAQAGIATCAHNVHQSTSSSRFEFIFIKVVNDDIGAVAAGTRKGDVQVAVTTNRLTVRLSWAGRVLDGPLTRKVKAGEMLWVSGPLRALWHP